MRREVVDMWCNQGPRICPQSPDTVWFLIWFDSHDHCPFLYRKDLGRPEDLLTCFVWFERPISSHLLACECTRIEIWEDDWTQKFDTQFFCSCCAGCCCCCLEDFCLIFVIINTIYDIWLPKHIPIQTDCECESDVCLYGCLLPCYLLSVKKRHEMMVSLWITIRGVISKRVHDGRFFFLSVRLFVSWKTCFD